MTFREFESHGVCITRPALKRHSSADRCLVSPSKPDNKTGEVGEVDIQRETVP